MALEMEMLVIVVHGEGDQATVNRLQDHRNSLEAMRLAKEGAASIPVRLTRAADEPPDIVIVMRDPAHDYRLEWIPKTWIEVAEWKRLIGFDEDLRRWNHGAKVKVRIGDK